MKKIYLVLSILFLFFFIIGIACYFTLPKTVGYFAGKIINGTVNIEDIKISYNKAFIVHIKGIEARGDLKGFIRSVYISFTLKRKLFFDEITISDFDLDVKLAKQKRPQFIKIPSEHISLENGKVKYEGQTFRILKAKLDYVKSKKLFVFSLNIENDRFFKSIKTEGTGTYSKREFEIKGKADIAGINLGQISNDLKGTTQVSCNFFYNKNGLKLEGPFDIVDFYLKLNFFTKPLLLKNVSGKLSLAYSKDMAVVKIRDVNFKSTPFELSLKLDSKGLHTLTINSNYVDVEDVKEYISFNYFSKDVGKYVGFIKGGKVKTNRLEYISRNDRFACNLSIKDTSLTYDDFEFTQIKADIVFDNNKANIKNLEARYKNSVIKDFAGDINYKKGYYARIKGSYFINLTDIPAKFNLDNIRFKNGTSEGEIEFEYKGPKEYIISGRGVLNKSEVSYNNISMIAFGDYRFTNDEIEFDPIVLTKGNTDLRLKGRWRKNLLNIKISGMLDVNTVKQFVKIPFDIKGLMDIDVDVRQQENTLQLLCNANLDHLSYKIEGYLKKEKGIKNSFALQALKRDEFIEIRDFNFKLEDLNLIFSGILSKKGAKDVRLKLLVPELKDKDYLLFINGSNAEGYVFVDLDVKKILFPLKNIPAIYGKLEIKNGYFRIPEMPSPIKNFDVMAYFNGDKLDLKIDHITCGNSLIKSVKFSSSGTEKPDFRLSVDIGHLDFKDFETLQEKKIKIYSIEPDSVLAYARGDIKIKAEKIMAGNKTGNDVILDVIYNNRIFNISSFKANALDGFVDVYGYLDFSKTTPHIRLAGKMSGISSGDFLKMLGAKTHLIESKEFISFDVNFNGNDIEGFKQTLSGKTNIYSEDGIIKRMNLLSKILGLLNVYDLLRGKVDLMSTGFKYKKTKANFVINNGVFTTNDYLIESPAMILTGQGNLNLIDETMEGVITVFPFVTLDKIISKIPLLRNILKDKKKGVVTAVFNVKGPIEDPDVKLAYMQTISSLPVNILRGIIGIPEGIIGFPKELFNDKE